MKFLRVLFAVALVMVGLINVVGCAAEEESTAPTTDTGTTTTPDDTEPAA